MEKTIQLIILISILIISSYSCTNKKENANTRKVNLISELLGSNKDCYLIEKLGFPIEEIKKLENEDASIKVQYEGDLNKGEINFMNYVIL